MSYAEISSYLLELGFSPKHKGYVFLRDAISLCLGSANPSRLSTDVYPIIARQHKTNACAVEKNISNAIGNAWLRGDIKIIEDEFGYTIDQTKGKPTVKQMIFCACENLRLRR